MSTLEGGGPLETGTGGSLEIEMGGDTPAKIVSTENLKHIQPKNMRGER